MVQSLFEFVFANSRNANLAASFAVANVYGVRARQVLRTAGPLVRWPAGPLARGLWPTCLPC